MCILPPERANIVYGGAIIYTSITRSRLNILCRWLTWNAVELKSLTLVSSSTSTVLFFEQLTRL